MTGKEIQEIATMIEDADMILVGIGEEFDNIGSCKKDDIYLQGKRFLKEHTLQWLSPAFDGMLREQKIQDHILQGCEKLLKLLEGKNYFVVSTAMNPAISTLPWKEGRIVTPCGGMQKKQCPNGCAEGLQALSEKEDVDMKTCLNRLLAQDFIADGKEGSTELPDLGVCPICNKPLILNNIYAEQYDENGYLPQWQMYTKWLQGTLNRKLVILELGVGMQFPSVIRWPFEKVAFFNNKAHLYRVNEKLYQLSEDLKGKGTAIPQNSIDWLNSL